MAEATHATTAPAQGPTLKREMGPVAILFSSVGVVIGSGWLLGAYHATLIAGPAAIVSWVIGFLAILILGLNLAELGGMYSVAGGLVRFPHFSFGSLAGFSAGWFYFLGSVTTAPIETLAVLTYAANYLHGLVDPATGSLIWPGGYVVAVVIMAVLTVLNIIGIRWMSEVNKYAVWWKILIPTVAIVAIIAVGRNTALFDNPMVTRPASDRPKLDWANGYWIAPWLIGVLVISYFSCFQAGGGTDGIPGTRLVGGTGSLHFGIDMIVTAVWSLVIYYIAVPVRLTKEKAQQYIVDSSSGELLVEPADQATKREGSSEDSSGVRHF